MSRPPAAPFWNGWRASRCRGWRRCGRSDWLVTNGAKLWRWDELIAVVRRQLNPSPILLPPRLLRRLDLLLRRGDEIPPDIARPLQRRAAKQQRACAGRPCGDGDAVAR